MPSSTTQSIPPDFFTQSMNSALLNAGLDDIQKILFQQAMLLDFRKDSDQFLGDFNSTLTKSELTQVRKQADAHFSLLEESYIGFARAIVLATINNIGVAKLRTVIPVKPDLEQKRAFMHNIILQNELTDRQVEELYAYLVSIVV